MSEKKRIPEIRFNGFEDEWEEKRLGDMVEITYGKDYKHLEKGDIPVYGTGGVISYVNQSLSYRDGIGLGRKGSISRPFKWNVDTLFNLSVKENTGFDYLFELINKVNWRKLDESTGVPSLSKNNIEKVKCLITTNIFEQNKIGFLFNFIEKTISNIEKNIDFIISYKQSMLQKMFPKEGEKVPEMRFEGFEGDWEEKLIKNIFKVTRGNVLSTKNISACKSNRCIYPVYSSQTQNNGLLGYYNEFLFENAITWTTDGANAGTVKFRKGKFYSTNVNGVLLSEEGYANYCISEILNREAYKHVSYVGNPKLMNNVMEKIKIKIPNSIDEQEKISEIIEKIDKKIALQREKLDTYKNLKKTLLDKMFV